MPDPARLADQVVEALRHRPDAYLVGIAGVPGSGKTTLCRELAARRPDAMIVPMDGYHLPRSRLDAEGMRRRGASHTFDSAAFQRDLAQFRQTHSGWFPTFDHAEQDPRPRALCVTSDVPLVIVEGIYVLMQSWRSEQWLICACFSISTWTKRSNDWPSGMSKRDWSRRWRQAGDARSPTTASTQRPFSPTAAANGPIWSSRPATRRDEVRVHFNVVKKAIKSRSSSAVS